MRAFSSPTFPFDALDAAIRVNGDAADAVMFALVEQRRPPLLLLLVLLRRIPRLDRERLYLLEFLLKAGREIGRAVLEKHDEAEREEREQSDPKKTADQGHGTDGNLLAI
jgi:hypothetical protein